MLFSLAWSYKAWSNKHGVTSKKRTRKLTKMTPNMQYACNSRLDSVKITQKHKEDNKGSRKKALCK